MTLSLPAGTARPPAAWGTSAAIVDGAPALELRPVDPAEWDRVSAGFDGLCQEQTQAFAAHRWPGLAHQCFVFSRAGETVGGVLVVLQSLPLRLATVAITKWGPMLADESRPDAGALYEAMVAALVAEFSQKRRMLLAIIPRAQADGFEHAALTRLGFADGAGVPFPNRYIVAIHSDADAQMAGLAQKWRYHLRKSFAAGLTFERAPAERLGEFMRLYDAMSARKQFPDHSAIATLPAMMAMPEGTGRPELFFVRKDGAVTAGAVIFTHGRTAAYLYGATDDDALALRAGYFLHWHVMRWLAGNTRATAYDLGGSDGFEGLHQFKRGMVGSLGHISPIPPMMRIAHGLRARALGTLALDAREVVHRARRSLDRLRGQTAPDQQERS